MNVLVTGISGYVGAVTAQRLLTAGHAVRGFARHPARVTIPVEVVRGDAVTGAGLDTALDGIDVAYFLIHSMEAVAGGDPFSTREQRSAERFAAAARRAGVSRVVYLGGLVPPDGPRSPHLVSRMAVESILRDAVPDTVVLRASIVIGARSRSFRFLVRLVERLPVIALPAWRDNRTAPIDERDIVSMLVAAAGRASVAGATLDVGGPDIVTYGQLIQRIADLMLLNRPTVGLRNLSLTPIASRVAAALAGEQFELIGPLMESLDSDLLPADGRAAELLEVRMHRLDAGIEHALAEWELDEPLAAR